MVETILESPSTTLLEHHLQGKHPNEARCEDSIYVGRDFLAVVDGSTTVGVHQQQCPSSGRLASQLIVQTIDSFSPNVTAREAVDILTHVIVSDKTFDEKDAPAAAVAIVSLSRREIWQVGNITAWEVGVEKPVVWENPMDVHVAACRGAYLRHIMLTTGIPEEALAANDPGRDIILPFLRAGKTHRNALGPEGYGCITNTPVPDEHLHVYRLKSSPGETELVLHTDGYPRTCGTLLEAEETLFELLIQDPLCMNLLPRTKGVIPGNHSYDDRAYLRVII